ncbi:hypothetical protein ZIOFF_074647 [Zingiber officinale]|uniref:Cysteine proteinase inhibitor n=1 Tax=Zingiber officinale TaxID=94328 RepID=A0A8J5ET21_ZINOF|nr:hypothetical protein ZIOFF_074647 [Zingiber officinale]
MYHPSRVLWRTLEHLTATTEPVIYMSPFRFRYFILTGFAAPLPVEVSAMASLPNRRFPLPLISLLVLFFSLRGASSMRMMGGIHDCEGFRNSAEILGFARFAVEEYNKKQNALLKFTQLLKAKEQVVAGKMYYLTLEANDCGSKKQYEAKVWVKPWMNFMELEDFKPLADSPSTSSQGE